MPLVTLRLRSSSRDFPVISFLWSLFQFLLMKLTMPSLHFHLFCSLFPHLYFFLIHYLCSILLVYFSFHLSNFIVHHLWSAFFNPLNLLLSFFHILFRSSFNSPSSYLPTIFSFCSIFIFRSILSSFLIYFTFYFYIILFFRKICRFY